MMINHHKDPYETTRISWNVYIRQFFFFRGDSDGNPRESTSQEIQKHLTRQLREEKQEASSWVQGGAKWGEITALKEVITPVSPL